MKNIELIIITAVVILLFVIYVVYATSRKKMIERYRQIKKEFPLNREISCFINREIMNDNFDKLTDDEMIILTKRINEINIVREEGNSLIAILYEGNELKSRQKIREAQSKTSLVKYMNKNYFTRMKTK